MAEKADKKTFQDFLEMGVNNLKDFLTIRGIGTSGYRKPELVARAFSAAEMDVPIIMSSEEQTKLLKVNYDRRLLELKLPDPKLISAMQKVDDITSWPKIDLGIIFEYILNVRDFDTEYIGKYKDQKAYSYFDSGFVGQILTYKHTDTETESHFIYCNVRASMVSEEKELWVAFNETGHIVAAWCSCMAGPSRCCNHIIAALYKVEYANTMGYCSPSCTSMPSSWNKSTKKIIEPKRIAEIIVRKKVRTRISDQASDLNREEVRMRELSKFDPRERVHQEITNAQVSNLFNCLYLSNPRAVLFKSIEGMKANCDIKRKLKIIDIANEIISSTDDDDSKISCFLKNLIFTESEVKAIKSDTRLQSKSKDWLDHRKGRLTASRHHEVYTKVNTILKTRSGIYPRPKTTQLVASIIFQDTNLDHITAIKWGRSKEETALKQFYAVEATKHIDFTFEKVGLCLDLNRAYIGASPDGIMNCKCHGKSAIEIKCPYKIKDNTISAGYIQCDFLGLVKKEICLKTSHKYYTQLQAQICLTNSSQGYFVVWTAKDIFIQKVEKDLDLWNRVSLNLELFYKNYVVKRILGITPLRYCGTCEEVLFEASEIGKSEFKLNSVKCDICNCWHHFKCQDIKAPLKPDDDWMCKSCLSDICN